MFTGLRFTQLPKGKNIPPQFTYVNSLLLEQFARLREIHNAMTITVTEQNLLVQLLQSLPFRLSGDGMIDARNAGSYINQIASTHGLVTDDVKGKMLEKAILPFSAREVIFAIARPFNIKDALKNWQELEPVKFISHPYMDVTLPVFSETLMKNYSIANTKLFPKDHTFAIEINIPMLVLMLSCWAQTNTKENMRNFIAKYVIVNAVKSFTDVSFMNRYFRAAVDPTRRVPTIITTKTYTLTMATSQLERAFDEVYVRTVKQNRDFPTIMAEMNLPFGTDIMQLLDNVVGTRQSRWAMDVAYMPLIRGLLSIDRIQTVQLSKPIKNALFKGYSQMVAGKYLDGINAPNMLYIASELSRCAKMC